MTGKKTFYAWVGLIILFSASIFHPSEYKFLVLSIIGIISSVGGLLILIWFYLTKTAEKKELLRDWHLALLIFNILFSIILGLALFTTLVHPDVTHGGNSTKIEWFLVIVSIIGIVGAIWAILARIDAQRSFEQAVKAHEQASKAAENAIGAFRAVAGMVSFDDLLIQDGEKQGVPMLEGLIGKAYEELILVLGIPAVGYFKKDIIKNSAGDDIPIYPLRARALKFCYQLAEFIREIPENPELKLVRLIYFDDQTLQGFSDAAVTANELDIHDKQKLEDAYQALKIAIEHIGSNTVLSCKRYSVELGVRFAIAHSCVKNKMTEDLGVVWVVSDFDHDSPGDFKAAGFTTRDTNVIENLRRLSKGYEKILPNLQPISTPISTP